MNFNIKFITIAFLCFLSACESVQSERWSKDKEQAIIDAKTAGTEVGRDYLQCYTLSFDAKNVCLGSVSAKHIKPEFQKNSAYIKIFQYENEKSGFVNMLNSHGAKCDIMEKGPQFIEEAKSYVAHCKNGNIYLINFNYSNKEWKLIK